MNSQSAMKRRKPNDEMFQLPFRCNREMVERLTKARGLHMAVTGERVTNNSFFIRLLEKGLQEFESGSEGLRANGTH